MFQIGDRVLYGIHGICQILTLEMRKIDRKLIEYYVLEPVDQPGARYYVPTQNEAAVSKLRPIMTQQELGELLSAAAAGEDAWISDENQRKQHYRELINSGDRVALLQMVHSLHKHKEEQAAAGRKFHLCDENFLRDAQKLLESEFSLVLNMDQDKVGTYVQNALKTE